MGVGRKKKGWNEGGDKEGKKRVKGGRKVVGKKEGVKEKRALRPPALPRPHPVPPRPRPVPCLSAA